MTSEEQQAYCRVCGEGCGPEVSFCVEYSDCSGLAVLPPLEPKPFWLRLLRRLLHLLALRR